MLIFLRVAAAREVYGVEVDPHESAEQVRRFLAARVPGLRIRALLYGGRMLNNDRLSLADYNVQKEAVIVVMGSQAPPPEEEAAAPRRDAPPPQPQLMREDSDGGEALLEVENALDLPLKIRRQITEQAVQFGDAVLLRVLEVSGVPEVSLASTWNPSLLVSFRNQLVSSHVRHKVSRLEFGDTTFGVVAGSPGADHIVDLGYGPIDAGAHSAARQPDAKEAAARRALSESLEAAGNMITVALSHSPGFCAPDLCLGHVQLDVRRIPRGTAEERTVRLVDGGGHMRVSVERHPLTSKELRDALAGLVAEERPLSRTRMRRFGVRLEHFRGQAPFEARAAPAPADAGADEEEDVDAVEAAAAAMSVLELAALPPARAAALSVPRRNPALRQLVQLLGDPLSGLGNLARRSRRTLDKVAAILVSQGAVVTRDAPSSAVMLCNANLDGEPGAAADLFRAVQALSGGLVRWVRPLVAGPAGRASTVLVSLKTTEAAVSLLLALQGRMFRGEPLQAAFASEGDGPGGVIAPRVLLRNSVGSAVTGVRLAGFALVSGPHAPGRMPASALAELALGEAPATVMAGGSVAGWTPSLVVLPSRQSRRARSGGHLAVWHTSTGRGGAAPFAQLERHMLRADPVGDWSLRVAGNSPVTNGGQLFYFRWADPILARQWAEALAELEHEEAAARGGNGNGGDGGGGNGRRVKSGAAKRRARRQRLKKQKQRAKAAAEALAVAGDPALVVGAAGGAAAGEQGDEGGADGDEWKAPELPPVADLGALAVTVRCRGCGGAEARLDAVLVRHALDGREALTADGEAAECRRCLAETALEASRGQSDPGEFFERFSLPDAQELLPPDALGDLNSHMTRHLVRAGDEFVECPKAGCGASFEYDPQAGHETRELGLDRRALTADAQRHFVTRRLLCRDCKTSFCRDCREVPYHSGFNCEDFRVFRDSPSCRFCGVGLMKGRNWAGVGPDDGPLHNVCDADECVASRDSACPEWASCDVPGHPCPGSRSCGASHAAAAGHCPPCLNPSCAPARSAAGVMADSESLCGICALEDLSASPVVAFGCGHAFHLRCVLERLAHPDGLRINFRHADCPLCNVPLASSHPALAPQLEALAAEREQFMRAVAEVAVAEGLKDDPKVKEFGDDPVAMGVAVFVMYRCFKCKEPYYSGRAECQAAGGDGHAADALKASDLKCFSCGGFTSLTSCKNKKHEASYVFKCRFCCSPAEWSCFNNVRMCEYCHSHDPWGRHKGTAEGQAERAKCPPTGASKCPMGLHPSMHKNYAGGENPESYELIISCGDCDRAAWERTKAAREAAADGGDGEEDEKKEE